MTELVEQNNNIYLILDGSKTVDKSSFFAQISDLLNLSDYSKDGWDALKDCLINVVSINSWKSNDTTTIEDVIDENTKVNIIWFDPIQFSKYNSADFLTALDILKEVTVDENNPLQFALAGQLRDINTDLYK